MVGFALLTRPFYLRPKPACAGRPFARTFSTMHRVPILIISLLTIISASIIFSYSDSQSKEPLTNEELLDEAYRESVFADLKLPLYFDPQSIVLNAGTSYEETISTEHIGLEPDGQLEVPSAWNLAGWYVRSARPGENGNVIIDGHYDTDSGLPGAFWGLKSTKVNDTLLVKDELGRTFSYKVVDSFYVDIQDPLRTSVLEDSGKAELTLITCGGVWNPLAQTYDKRLIVKAELLEEG